MIDFQAFATPASLWRYYSMRHLFFMIILLFGLLAALSLGMGTGVVAAPATAPHRPAGVTYHVALTGDDANPGTEAAPFRTIKHGASVLQAGDVLIIHDGDYGSEFDIQIPNSGTAANPITIKAENRGAVMLHGSRLPDQIDGGGTGFDVEGRSYIVFDGLSFSDYSVGIGVYGDPEGLGEPYAGHHITITHSRFQNNGDLGIEIVQTDNVLISHCTFISEEPPSGWPDPENPNAIQDYGVYFWHTHNSVVEDSYFYGAHNQALSFKQGCYDSVARRNIFEGALYTALYLGQNRREDGRPKCMNLTAEYNIVRGTAGYRVKSPIRVDNVENAIVRNNYVEGFDETNNTSGINVFDEALGAIEIYDNIAAFGVDNENSGGVYIAYGLDASTQVSVHHNTIYDVVQDMFDNAGGTIFTENISHQCAYYDPANSSTFHGDPLFINGDPVQQPVSSGPTQYDFDAYYRRLTDPFLLRADSAAHGNGWRGMRLRVAADDAALHLTWVVNPTLPVTSTWRISYDGPAGDEASPVTDIPTADRGHTLTGLTNGAPYTLTLNAMVAGAPTITDTVVMTPGANALYFPLLQTAIISSHDLRLSWAHDSDYAYYWAWRGETPYFGLSGPGQGEVHAAPWQFDDAGAVGDAAQNHYYRIVGIKNDGSATISRRVGEFDFDLTPGGP